MKIDGARPVSAKPLRARSGGESGSAFAAHAPDSAHETAPSRTIAALGGLDAVLMLQLDQPSRRRRQIARGVAALDALDALALATLDGADPERAIGSLRAALADREQTTDDGLDSVLQEIDVRASVEIAKRERALSASLLRNSM
jgi:hypothetical protein